MNERPLINSSGAGVVSLPEETQFAANGVVSRTILSTTVSRVILFGFAEGQELTEHSSSYEALVQMLSGECEFVLDGKAHHLKVGDFVFMPPRLPHSLKAISQFSMLLTLSKPGSTVARKTQANEAQAVHA